MNALRLTLVTLFVSLFASTTATGQTPDGIQWQGVVRDAAGAIIANEIVDVRLTLHLTNATGPIEYQETHSTTTNQFGLVNLVFGQGTPDLGTFAAINWFDVDKFLQVEIDNGSGFADLGAQQLMSVPFAKMAENTLNDNVNDADSDPTNELQTIGKIGSAITLSNGGGTVIDEVADPDPDPTNELQVLSQAGSTVTLSNGGGSISIDDPDADPTNELNQILNFNGTNLSITDPGGTLSVDISSLGNDADPDPTNELNQTLTFDGSNLDLTDAGGTLNVDLSSLQNDADPDPTNELIQSVTFTGGTLLNITDAGATWSVDLSALEDDADPDPTNELNQSLFLNGADLELTDAGGTLVQDLSSLIDDADADPTNELNQTLTLSGTILQLTDAGGTLNQDLVSLVDDADADPTNELQNISASGPVSQPSIDLDQGGGSVQLFGGGATTLNQSGNNITISSTDNVDDADNDPTNEIQQISASGGANPQIDLSLGGGNVTFTGSGGATLTQAGNNINVFSTDNVDDADNDPTNELNVSFQIVGTDLVITDAGGSLSVPLASLDDMDWSGKGSGQMWPTNLSDRIGIGTSTPVGDLEVSSAGSTIQRITGTDMQLQFNNSTAAMDWVIDRTGNNNAFEISRSIDNFVTRQPVILIDGVPGPFPFNAVDLQMQPAGGDGNVGIGFLSGGPQAKLHIAGGDVMIQRSNALISENPGPATPIELIQLDLVSTEPVIVVGENTVDLFDLHIQTPIGAGRGVQVRNGATTIAHFDQGGNVGVGTELPLSRLSVFGNASVGDGYAPFAAPTDGMIIEGNVGIGTNNPQNRLDVFGGAVVGTGYAGTNTSPANGMLVEGRVGIGLTNPQAPLDVGVIGGSAAPWIRITDVANTGTPAMTNVAGYDNGNNLMWYVGDSWTLLNDLALANVQTGGHLYFRTENLNRAIITNTGNMGIGTITPSATLDLVGTFQYDHPSQGLNNLLYDNTGTGDAQWASPAVLGLVSGTGAATQVAFWNGASTITGENNLWWDSVNDYLAIGLTNPNAELHVYDPAGHSWSLFTTPTTGTGGVGDGLAVGYQDGGTPGAHIWNGENTGTYFGTNGLYRMAISGAGDVGIGTITPGTRLDVAGGDTRIERGQAHTSTNPLPQGGGVDIELVQLDLVGVDPIVVVGDNSADVEDMWLMIPSGAGKGVQVRNSGGVTTHFDDGGNVGIGTTSPTEDLHVVGDQRLEGAFHDGVNSPGAAGEILSSTVGATAWASPAALGLVSGTGAATQVAFWNSGTTITGENNLWWNSANDRLGIGTASPATILHVSENAPVVRVQSTQSTTLSSARVEFGNSAAGYTMHGWIGEPGSGDYLEIGAPNFISFNTNFTGDRVRINNNGNVGIGTGTPLNPLDVDGAAVIGDNYAGSVAAPVDGALIEGQLGLGTTTPQSKLDVEGNAVIGSNYSGTTAAPAEGLLVEGAVGLGTTTPQNRLDVEGAVAVGDAYSGTSAAPANGVIIEGNVGIGTDAPTAQLDVDGVVRIRQGAPDANDVLTATDNLGNAVWTDPNTLITDHNTLDEAYDEGGAGAGRIITADNGAVQINGTDGLIVSGRMVLTHNHPAFSSFINLPNNPAIGLSIQTGGLAFAHFRNRVSAFGLQPGDNVGIGTSGPTAKLDVNGVVRIRGGAPALNHVLTSTDALGNAVWTDPNTLITDHNTLDEAYDEGGAGAGRIITADNGAVRVAGTDGLTVDGFVGVGVIAPSASLDVVGTFQYQNASAAANRVLTSTDALGNAVWTDPNTLITDHNTLDEAYDEGGAGLGRSIDAVDGTVEVAGEDGFVTTGTFGSGLAIGDVTGIPDGAGTRMFFYPNKAAFRAGRVLGTEWDDVNVGDESVAMGRRTTASGNYSFAMGNLTVASGFASVALGETSTASGLNAIAIGDGAVATGIRATAFGNQTLASGAVSTTLGLNTIASGVGSVAMGSATLARSYTETVVGLNNTDYAPNSTFAHDPADRVFVVGNGVSTASRSDALVVLKSGNTGIGTATPTETLHVSGDQRLTGAFFDGTNSAGANGWVLTSTGGGTSTVWSDPETLVAHNTLDDAYDEGGAGAGRVITADAGAVHVSGTGGLHVDDNTGIGLTTPTARLHVRGSGTTFATSALNVEDNSGTSHLSVRDDGFVLVSAPNLVSEELTVGGSIAANDDGPTRLLVQAAAGGNPSVTFRGFQGVIGAGLPTQNNDPIGTLSFGGLRTGLIVDGSSLIQGRATENWTPTATGSKLTFRTTANTTTGSTERMVIDHDGEVGIGTTTPSATLDVEGTMQYVDGNEAAGKVLVSDASGNASWEAGSVLTKSPTLNSAAANLTTVFSPIGPAFNVTKQSADSKLRIVMNSRVNGGTFAGGATAARFEIRVNGAASNFDNQATIHATSTTEFRSILSIVEGLGAGVHTVQVYANVNAGTSTGASLDPGGWDGRIIVEETF